MIKKLFIILFFILALLVAFIYIKFEKVESIVRSYPTLHKYVKAVAEFTKSTGETDSRQPQKLIEAELDINVHANNVIGPFEHFYDGLGMGTFHDGLIKAHNYEFFKLVGETNKKHRLMNYVNMKCIFMDQPKRGSNDYGAHVYQKDQSGKVTYYWGIVDAVIDRLLENGLKPIISLTFMPEEISTNPEWINPWNRGIISVPKDYMLWRNLIFETIKHLKQRYGSAEIATWYFEAWNEPDLFRFFWRAHPDKEKYPKRGDFDEYCKLYDYTIDGAVAADPGIKIGGPAIAGDKLFLTKFLEHCFEGKNYVTGEIGSRVDFISRHHYGSIDTRIVPKYVDFIQRIKKTAGSAFADLEILITETGPTTHPKPWLNKRYVAAWIVKEVDAFLHISDQHGADFLPDIACFWTKPVSMNFGNQFSLATALGPKLRPDPKMLLKRPAFNGYEAVNLLGTERLQLSGAKYGDPVHGIATRQGDTSIEVLLYHLIEGDTYNNMKSNYTINLTVTDCHLPEYTLEYYAIDETHSNGYNYWIKMGSPEFPDEAQLKALKARDDLELFEPVSRIKTRNGLFKKQLNLTNNSVVFLRFRAVEDNTPPLKPKKMDARLSVQDKEVRLSWSKPDKASDGDQAASYLVYRNGELLTRQFDSYLQDSAIRDNMEYHYAVKAVDDAGNTSREALKWSVVVPKDISGPEVSRIETPNAQTVIVYFNESLTEAPANNASNYSINDLEIKQAVYSKNNRTVTLTTSRQVARKFYALQIENIIDCAQIPNLISAQNAEFNYELSFIDHFDNEISKGYIWMYLEGPTKQCHPIFDRLKKRMLVLVGDDTKHKFSHPLPENYIGTFELDFLPVKKYPSGGVIVIYLKQDDENYYKIFNTDGYGAGGVEKVVNGEIVEKADFSTEYHQARNYLLKIAYRPGSLSVQAFNEERTLTKNQAKLLVKKFEVELAQQDASFDNIVFSGE